MNSPPRIWSIDGTYHADPIDFSFPSEGNIVYASELTVFTSRIPGIVDKLINHPDQIHFIVEENSSITNVDVVGYCSMPGRITAGEYHVVTVEARSQHDSALWLFPLNVKIKGDISTSCYSDFLRYEGNIFLERDIMTTGVKMSYARDQDIVINYASEDPALSLLFMKHKYICNFKPKEIR